jgi:hypothetical protein
MRRSTLNYQLIVVITTMAAVAAVQLSVVYMAFVR